MNYKKILVSAFAVMALILGGCAKNIPPGDYDAAEVGKVKKVVPGVIISMRPVRIHNKASENMSTTAAPEADMNTAVSKSHGYEYVIKLNSGAIISVVQADDLVLKTKQHILVIYGENTRIMPDDGSDES